MESPKTRLIADKHTATELQGVLDSALVEKAADAALLEYIHNLPDSLAATDAIAHYNRIVGARDFLRTLLTIADKAKPLPVPPSTKNLNHQA